MPPEMTLSQREIGVDIFASQFQPNPLTSWRVPCQLAHSIKLC